MSGLVIASVLTLLFPLWVESVSVVKLVRGDKVTFVRSTIDFGGYRLSTNVQNTFQLQQRFRPEVSWDDWFSKYQNKLRTLHPEAYQKSYLNRFLTKIRDVGPQVSRQSSAVVSRGTSALSAGSGRTLVSALSRLGASRLAGFMTSAAVTKAIPVVGTVIGLAIDVVMTTIMLVEVIQQLVAAEQRRLVVEHIKTNYGYGFISTPIQHFPIWNATDICHADFTSVIYPVQTYSIRENFTDCNPTGPIHFCLSPVHVYCARDYNYTIKFVAGYSVFRDVCSVSTFSNEFPSVCLVYVKKGVSRAQLRKPSIDCRTFYNITEDYIGVFSDDRPFIFESRLQAVPIPTGFVPYNGTHCPFLNVTNVFIYDYEDLSDIHLIPAEITGYNVNFYDLDAGLPLTYKGVDLNSDGSIHVVTNAFSEKYTRCYQALSTRGFVICDDASDGESDRQECEETDCRHYLYDTYTHSRRCYVCTSSAKASIMMDLRGYQVQSGKATLHYTDSSYAVISGPYFDWPVIQKLGYVVSLNLSLGSWQTFGNAHFDAVPVEFSGVRSLVYIRQNFVALNSARFKRQVQSLLDPVLCCGDCRSDNFTDLETVVNCNITDPVRVQTVAAARGSSAIIILGLLLWLSFFISSPSRRG